MLWWKKAMRRAVYLRDAAETVAAVLVGFLAGAGRVLGDMIPAPTAILAAAGVHGMPVLPMAAGALAGMMIWDDLPGWAYLPVAVTVAIMAVLRGCGRSFRPAMGGVVLLAARLCVIPFLPSTPMGIIRFAAESVLAGVMYAAAYGSVLAWKRGYMPGDNGESLCPTLAVGLILGALPMAGVPWLRMAVLSAALAACLIAAMTGGAAAASACAAAWGSILWIMGGIDAETAAVLVLCGWVAGCLRGGGKWAVGAGCLLAGCTAGLALGAPWGEAVPYPVLAVGIGAIWAVPGSVWDRWSRQETYGRSSTVSEDAAAVREMLAERMERFAMCFREMSRVLRDRFQDGADGMEGMGGRRRGESSSRETRSMLAEQLEGTCAVLEELADAMDADLHLCEGKKGQLEAALADQDIEPVEVGVLEDGMGRSDICVRIPSCGGKQICRGRVQRVLSRAAGCPMHLREDCVCGGEICSLHYEPVRKLEVGSAIGQEAADGRICGDACASIALGGQRHMLAISDGMGIGRDAAEESAATLRLLESLYLAGFPEENIFHTVNRLLLLRPGEEMYATADLCLLDLVEGSARFVKIGGAPTYILRGGAVTVVHAPTLPMGIVEDIRPVTVERSLEPGDTIVMVSDGVAGDGAWLEGILPRLKGLSPEALAARLLQRAADMGLPADDRTVLVARVETAGIRRAGKREQRNWRGRVAPEGMGSANSVQYGKNVVKYQHNAAIRQL